MENRQNSTNINWFPGHMQKTRRQIKEEMRNIDIIYELVDARIPKSSRIEDIEEIINNKPHILLMTKKDLADEVKLNNWINYYQKLGINTLSVDLTKNEDIKQIVAKTNELMEDMQKARIAKGLKTKEIRVLVLGIPNVGKSTLINKMVGKRVASVGNTPGITKNLVALKTNYNITLVDTPGILWPKIKDREVALNLASFSSIKLEVLDINEIAVHIIQKLVKSYPQKLVDRYKITANLQDLEVLEIYEAIAKAIGAFKNQEVDYEKVSLRIINDLKNEYIKGVCFD